MGALEYRGNREHDFRAHLRVSQAVEREQPIEDKQRGNLQHDIAQNGENQRLPSHADRLEHAHGDEVYAQERNGQAHATQKARAIFNDRGIVHKHADERVRREGVENGHGNHHA